MVGPRGFPTVSASHWSTLMSFCEGLSSSCWRTWCSLSAMSPTMGRTSSTSWSPSPTGNGRSWWGSRTSSNRCLCPWAGPAVAGLGEEARRQETRVCLFPSLVDLQSPCSFSSSPFNEKKNYIFIEHLACARRCPKCPTHIGSFDSLNLAETLLLSPFYLWGNGGTRRLEYTARK